MRKGIVFYTAGEVKESIAQAVKKRLQRIAQKQNIYIVTCRLQYRLDWGDENLALPTTEKSPLTQFKQILMCLEAMPDDIDTVYFCEDDVLYNESHFDFTLPTTDAYYYNTNIWKLWLSEGIATYEDNYMPLSGLVANKTLMLGHYQRRVAKILQNQVDTLLKGQKVEREGYSKHMGYEPGGHMNPRGVDEYKMIQWQSKWPLIDIRHDHNLTKGKRTPEDYHNPELVTNWVQADIIPGIGNVEPLVKELL